LFFLLKFCHFPSQFFPLFFSSFRFYFFFSLFALFCFSVLFCLAIYPFPCFIIITSSSSGATARAEPYDCASLVRTPVLTTQTPLLRQSRDTCWGGHRHYRLPKYSGQPSCGLARWSRKNSRRVGKRERLWDELEILWGGGGNILL
jgi:hypothetical protein